MSAVTRTALAAEATNPTTESARAGSLAGSTGSQLVCVSSQNLAGGSSSDDAASPFGTARADGIFSKTQLNSSQRRKGVHATRWSLDDDAVIRAQYPDKTIPVCEIAHLLGRTFDAVAGRARQIGALRSPRPNYASIDEAIDLFTVRAEPGACWLWTGPTFSSHHYPRISFRGEKISIHRYLVEKSLGRRLGEGELARHQCDNPSCSNPGHLLPGDAAANSRDAVERDRVAFGERHWAAKLTVADVHAIRRSQLSNVELETEFGVNRAAISRIRSRKAWRRA